MRKFPGVGIVLLLLAFTLAGCGLFSSGVSDMSVSEKGGGGWVIRFACAGADAVVVKVIDGDGVRYQKKFSIDSLEKREGRYEIVLASGEVKDGFYETGTLTIAAYRGDRFLNEESVRVYLPMIKPTKVRIQKAYKDGDKYVVVVRAEKDGEDAVLGHKLKVYIGDMSGRQMYLGEFDVFRKKVVRIEIPLSDVGVSYTADVLLKVKLEDFGL